LRQTPPARQKQMLPVLGQWRISSVELRSRESKGNATALRLSRTPDDRGLRRSFGGLQNLKCAGARIRGVGGPACANAAREDPPKKLLRLDSCATHQASEGFRSGHAVGLPPRGANEPAQGKARGDRVASTPGECLRLQRGVSLPHRGPSSTTLANALGNRVCAFPPARRAPFDRTGPARAIRVLGFRPFRARRVLMAGSGGVAPDWWIGCAFAADVASWEPGTAEGTVPFLSPDASDNALFAGPAAPGTPGIPPGFRASPKPEMRSPPRGPGILHCVSRARR
jgi:hypothetical protein